MIRNILKIVATLVVGYLLGLTFGAIFGIFLGGIPALFFREIINFNQTVLMSITLTLILGVLLGLFAMRLVNRIFDASGKPLIGVLVGLMAGFIVVFFIEGVIDISDSEMFIKPMYIFPIVYSGVIGSEIGSIIFPIIGGLGVIRDIITKTKEAKNHEDRLDQFQGFLDKQLPGKEKHGK